MTHEEWRADVSLAIELKKMLDLPVLKAAISILDSQTMARTLAGNGLLQLSDKAHVLFGYDAGRASILSDLQNLSVVPEEMKELPPSYTTEF
jgi:hypothetical protein